MRTNFLIKLIYILFMLFGIQLAYADKLSFDFVYGSGIESVYFDTSELEYEDYATDIDNYSSFSVDSQVLSTENKVIVQLDITHNGSPDIAKVFNVISGYLPTGDDSHVMELNGPESYAVALDFWAMAPLYVNGHFLGNVTLAHNNHSNSIGANDWWITVDSGKRYELGNGIALTVNDNAGNYYCLKQNGTNYQIQVLLGACSNGSSGDFTDNWQYVGNANLAQTQSENMSLTVGPNDQPIVAYTSKDSVSGIKVLMYNNNSGAWAEVNNPTLNLSGYVSEGGAYYPSVKYLDYGGVSQIYVAYQDACVGCSDVEYNYLISVQKYDLKANDGWSYYGNRGFTVSSNVTRHYPIKTSSHTDIKLAFAGNTPYVASILSFPDSNYSCDVSIISNKNHNCIYTIKYNSQDNTWEQYGDVVGEEADGLILSGFAFAASPGNAPAYISYIPLKGEDETPSLPFLSENSSGKSWVSSSKTDASPTVYSSIAIDAFNNAWMAYQGSTKNSIVIAEFLNGTKGAKNGTWAAPLPTLLTGANIANSYINLAFDTQSPTFYNQPIVAFIDGSNSNRATVKYFSGNQWYKLGNPGFPYTGSGYKNVQIAIGKTAIFVAFEDQDGNISVMKYNK